ncbi:ABC transporter permease [Mangrovicoccus algicola]|uniref:ABC transporter permease n=1 Tax=Mangrovicoccus algicola TaxID=2771008 RepID=A0A8J6YUT2_9RHOB|nr:ABC transporter permease [Mangrovicoccus algicola]MBE3638140.1 ABC transporter permease [Mangrovicoccus algicola]
MTGFLLRRVLRALLTIFIVVLAAFLALRTTSDPAIVILGPDAPPAAVAAFHEAWGLDRPLWVQFGSYMSDLLQGQFGKSMLDGQDALSKVTARVAVTLQIMMPALLLGVVTGVGAGIVAALHRGRPLDRIVMLGAVSGFAVPGFVFGLVMVLIFAVNLQWLPSGGNDSWQAMIMPILTLATGWAAILARFTRSAMIEVLDQPYIRTGSAKGLIWREVVMRHALPNAAIPVITMIGFMVGGLLAGAVVIESVFSWPGIGQLIVSSVSSRDVAVVQCVLVLVATTMVVSNMIVDLLYGWLDPRMREAG